MKKINELTVFSVGDSSDPKLWSNVPFFFTETLMAKGVKVNRVWLRENSLFTTLFDKFIFRIISLFYRGHTYNYNKTPYNSRKLADQIAESVKQFKNSDAFVFLNFDYHAESDKPTVLFHDWTFEHNIKTKLKRQPFFFEKKFIDYQKDKIEKADLVISMFKDCALEMKERYKNPNIFFLGGNVVNNFYKEPINAEVIINKKRESKKILFIGNYKYKVGAQLLLKAFEILKTSYPGLTLDFIGLQEKDFESIPEGVTCHGYLDKGSKADNKLYYDLLTSATIFVNPTPTWGGYSSTIEAMYFYSPVIVAPYKDFINEFGENLNFGLFNKEFKAEVLADEIKKIIENDNYVNLCRNAHKAVEDYTWDNYIERFMEKIKSL